MPSDAIRKLAEDLTCWDGQAGASEEGIRLIQQAIDAETVELRAEVERMRKMLEQIEQIGNLELGHVIDKEGRGWIASDRGEWVTEVYDTPVEAINELTRLRE